jgi:hypothetical protein
MTQINADEKESICAPSASSADKAFRVHHIDTQLPAYPLFWSTTAHFPGSINDDMVNIQTT